MDTINKQPSSFRILNSNALLFLVCISSVLVIILATNLDLFCIPKQNRMLNISNVELFLIYSVIFTVLNTFLLRLSSTLKFPKSKIRKITLAAILIVQIAIITMLFIIYGQIKISSLYYNAIFNAIVYLSLTSSAGFLALASTQFLRWFARRKNYLVLTYAVVMLVLCINSIIGFLYIAEVSKSHASSIKYKSCSVMMGVLVNPNPETINILANLYDIASFFSFIFAWIVSVLMLKQYFKRQKKVVYWILVSLPLIFFVSRYEVALYYFLNNQAENILSYINFASDTYGSYLIENILNSNLLVGAIFFGMAFLTIAFRVVSQGQQRNALILTGIGMIILFGSKDISTLILSSYPPVGAISISFLGLASYIFYLGIFNAATVAARETSIRKDLSKKILNDSNLLRSITSSQRHLDTERNVKNLMNLSADWQEENKRQDLTEEEIRTIIKDVISELNSRKK